MEGKARKKISFATAAAKPYILYTKQIYYFYCTMRGNSLLKFIDKYIGSLLILFLAAWRKLFSTPNKFEVPQKILLIKFAALGDAVLLLPVFSALRKKYPSVSLVLLGTKINQGIMELSPNAVDEFIVFDFKKVITNPFYIFQFASRLKAYHFDIIIDFEQWNHFSAVIALLTGVSKRLGFFYSRIRSKAFTQIYGRNKKLHETENFFNVAGFFHENKNEITFDIANKEIDVVQKTLEKFGWNKTKKIILIHPGCGEHGYPREWSPLYYGELCRRLSLRGEYFFVFTGSESEKKLISAIVSAVQKNSFVWNEKSLTKLSSLISLASLAISGNTGIMHLIAAFEIPQIALHGPTNYKQWGPLNKNAIVIESSCPQCPCLDFGSEYHRTDGYCMAQITIEEVFQEAVKLLGKS